MYKQRSDKTLIKEVLQGEREAFDTLVLRYQQKLIRSVNAYIHDPQEARDVLQDTFMRAYRALADFRGESTFYTWLHRIAMNTAINHLKMRGKHYRDISINTSNHHWKNSTDLLEEKKTPEELLISNETKRDLLAAFNALPKNLRDPIILREINGLSYEEIAKQLHCPVGTVRSRIFRARANVDEHMRHKNR